MSTDFDKEVRSYVYDHTMKEGSPPSSHEVAEAISSDVDRVRDCFQRLADAHVLVLQQGSGEILMANPFSAVPTPFIVQTNKQSYYGNCIWDAMGIPSMLKTDAAIKASCGCCRTALDLEIKDGELIKAEGIVHFAIPASRWWDDIVFN